jgi:hypothetical protein
MAAASTGAPGPVRTHFAVRVAEAVSATAPAEPVVTIMDQHGRSSLTLRCIGI